MHSLLLSTTTVSTSFRMMDRLENTSVSMTQSTLPQSFHDSSSTGLSGSIPSDYNTRERRHTRVFRDFDSLEIFATESESEGDDIEPFQIHRKLLRRRHVRKEQLRRRRENAAAEKLAEQRQSQSQQQHQEKSKRGRVHGTADSTSDVDGSMEICPTDNSTSESTHSKVNNRKNASGKSTATSTSQNRLWMMIGSNSPLSSPAGTMIPAFSPLRPTKRRKIFAGSSH